MSKRLGFVGGGDWAKDRLVPDVVKAVLHHETVVVRSPNAIRPWQHVLEPLSGYLLLANRLYEHGQEYAEAWNFGPYDEDAKPVWWIVEKLCSMMGSSGGYTVDGGEHPHEARYLKLDCSKARQLLGWQPRLRIESALERVALWARAYEEGDEMRSFTLEQIREYESLTSDHVGMSV